MPTARWDDLRGRWTIADVDGSPIDPSLIPRRSLDLMLLRLLPPAREEAMSLWRGGLIREADAWFQLDPELLPVPACEFRMRWTVPSSPRPEMRCSVRVRIEGAKAVGTITAECRRAVFRTGDRWMGAWEPWSSRRVSSRLDIEDDMTSDGHTFDIDETHTDDA